MRYKLDDRFQPVFFCDPDYYPVGSEEQERQRADDWWADADRTGDEVTTILSHLGLAGASDDAEILTVYREHKRFMAIALEATATGYTFTLRSGTETDALEIAGTIARDGTITVERRDPANTACPICLTAATMIGTPNGPVAVAAIRAGMPVWTLDAAGHRARGIVLRTARRSVGPGALLVRVTLADGRSIVASAAHPTADGRAIGTLTRSAPVDGSIVVSIDVVGAPDGVTYDLLPSGSSGAYWADGILLGSTLATG